MSNTFLHPRRHTSIVLLLLTVLVVALVSAGALIGARRAETPTAAASTPAVASAAAVVPTSMPTPAGGEPETGTPVMELVRGRTQISAVAVGYPQTQAGAVSAAIEYVTALAGLDPDRQAAVGRLVADSSWALAGQQFAAGALATRRAIGLSASGPVPSGASIEVTPVSYQVRDVGAERVNVLLLSYLVTSTPQAGTLSRTILQNVPMHWDGLDWKILKSTDAADKQYRALLAQPGTATAAALGWRWITR